mmetsp:Transcript_24537/g.73539  ORF Transcript_24537/g.73539 Transcript_24537/m.73539 type:complete len:563 (-) Transcript_24537:87-1775(-)
MKMGKLADLHTHLLGMGSAKFWMHVIMEDVLPKLASRAYTGAVPIEEYAEKPTHATGGIAQPIGRSVVDIRKEYPNFTTEVVYPVDVLCVALGIDPKAFRSNDTKIAEVGSKLAARKTIKELVKTFTVYNAREQEMQKRVGITNCVVIKQLFHPDNMNMWENCFEMKGENHERYSKTEDFMHKFTPAFYPRRFILKDPMYEQYPLVLDALLHHVLDRYVRSGVSYVEFSVGFGDLVNRPWIFKHLALPEFPRGLCEHIPPLPAGVTFRYLAGFNRLTVDEAVELHDGVHAMAIAANLAEKFDSFGEAFTKHRDQLAKIRAAFALSRRVVQDAVEDRKLHNVCVGLDFLSDEFNHPTCPFALTEFLDFLKEERDRRGGQFGFRYHCGEADTSVATEHLIGHMGVSAAVIERVLSACDWNPDADPPPLRIGHGIAFRHFEEFDPESSDAKNPEGKLRASINRAQIAMKARRIPIEVNLTSNDHLEGDARRAEILTTLLDRGFTVVLATDNDGIWPTDQGQFLSVAGEFYGAITGKLTSEDYPMTEHAVANVIRNFRLARFTRAT